MKSVFLSLVRFGSQFKGFLRFAAFIILVFMGSFYWAFSQGSFDPVIGNFGKLTGDQFFYIVMAILAMLFIMILVLIILGFKSTVPRPADQAVIYVIVHENGDQTALVAGAKVTLVLGEPEEKETSSNGAVNFTVPGYLVSQQFALNARKEGYKKREPLQVLVRQNERIFISLERDESRVNGAEINRASELKLLVDATGTSVDAMTALDMSLKGSDKEISRLINFLDAREEGKVLRRILVPLHRLRMEQVQLPGSLRMYVETRDKVWWQSAMNLIGQLSQQVNDLLDSLGKFDGHFAVYHLEELSDLIRGLRNRGMTFHKLQLLGPGESDEDLALLLRIADNYEAMSERTESIISTIRSYLARTSVHGEKAAEEWYWKKLLS